MFIAALFTTVKTSRGRKIKQKNPKKLLEGGGQDGRVGRP